MIGRLEEAPSAARPQDSFLTGGRYPLSKTLGKTKPNKDNKSKGKRHVFSNIFLVLILLVFLAGGVAVGLLAGVTIGCVITTKPVSLSDLYVSEKETVIYDSKGNVMTSLSSPVVENSIWAGIDEIPENLRNAFVAIEDERFYSHNGVDIKRSASAVVGFFVPGFSSHGGSTITQQLVKNVTGDDSKSVPRKIREQWRAIQLENLVNDKNKILELYLNKIYFANNCYGVQIAANTYFGCDVSELNLAQCAFLAGIPNSPAKYNPATTTGRQNEYKRQILILDKMMELGFITEEEYIEAIQTELVFEIDTPKNKVKTTKVYSYFEDMVIKSVREDLVAKGYTTAQANNLIYNSGIRIYTTQDTEIQDKVTEIFTSEANFRMNVGRDPEDCSQCAIAIMDHNTGEIIAIYGGYGEKTQSLTYNRATDIRRQPGSTIKPLLVYGPLIDKKIITAGEAYDEEAPHLDLSNTARFWPSNWDNKVHGLLCARYALMMSYNIPAANWFVKNMPLCLDYLKRVGIDKYDEPYPSTALGGFKKGVSPLEMCAGYSAIANGGIYYKPICYTKVYSDSGELLLDNTQRQGTEVYENGDTATVVTSMLESVVYDSRSTGRFAGITYGDVRLPLGGKTGSTTDLVDYWFCGFSAYYTAACWYGYDDSSPCDVNIEGGWATTIWHKVMSEIHKDLPIKDFTRSKNVVRVEICSSSGKRATEACKNDPRHGQWVYEEVYIRGTEPSPGDYCDCHKKLKVCTASTDSEGKHCLATEYCELLGNAVEKYGLFRDEETVEYIRSSVDEYNEAYGSGGEMFIPTDWEYELSHTYCTECREKALAMGLLIDGDDDADIDGDGGNDAYGDADIDDGAD